MEKDDPVFLDTRADGAPLVFPLGTETEASVAFTYLWFARNEGMDLYLESSV